jgi:hypothetical protein
MKQQYDFSHLAVYSFAVLALILSILVLTYKVGYNKGVEDEKIILQCVSKNLETKSGCTK